MKLLLVISLSAMLALCAVAEDRHTNLKERFLSLPREQQVARIKAVLVRSFMDDKLKEFLENSLKDIIIHGSEDWGIPPLDPLEQDHIDVNLNEEQALMNATVDKLRVTGLSNYTVDLAKFDLLKQNMTFGLLFLHIRALADHYWMNGTVAEMVPLFGEGSIDVSVMNLGIGGNFLMGISGSSVFLKDVAMDITIGALKTNITGLLGGGELGEMINEIISESAPDLWENLKPDIMPTVNNMIMEIGNEALSGLTLQDIIDMITGNNKPLR